MRHALVPALLTLACGLASHLGAAETTEVATTTTVAAPPSPITFAPMIRQVAPCVVTVFSSRTIHPAADEDSDSAVRRYFGLEPGEPKSHKQEGLGSGVVVRADGYILTNNHVVEDADEVKVSFSDSRAEFVARVVGTDPKTDIAVLKIDPGGRALPIVHFADSRKVVVGDLVFAIGNPFGVGQTVTMGIISATGRGGIGIEDYEDFLQTDASINPGNSGGALVDSNGGLVGINTAIISPTGSNLGIGFAVPATMARGVMDAIIAHGKVTRGYLGVRIQELTASLASKLSLPSDDGALISEVEPQSPAMAAGLEAGDAIVSLNGGKIDDARHLRLAIALLPPGSPVTLTADRAGTMHTFTTTLRDLQKGDVQKAIPLAQDDETSPVAHGQLGLVIDDLSDEIRHALKAPDDIQGAVITQVEPGSHADEAGLKRGMVITSVEHKPVASAQDLVTIIDATKGDLLLSVWREGGNQFVILNRN